MAAGASQTPEASASAALQVLQELQRWLQRQHSSQPWPGTDSSAAGAYLTQLRRYHAAIRDHTSDLDEALSIVDLVCTAAASCMDALAQALLRPPASLYSGLSGAPAQPAEDLVLAGEQHQLLVAAHLQLLLLLLPVLRGLEAPGASADPPSTDGAAGTGADVSSETDSRARNRPKYFVGIVEIKELPDDADTSSNLTAQQQALMQLQQLATQLLLVAAMYASDSSSAVSQHAAQPGTPTAPVLQASSSSSSSSRVFSSLSDSPDAVVQSGLQLSSPWSALQCQQLASDLGQQLLACMKPPNSISVSSSARRHGGGSGSIGGSTSQEQQHQQHEMVSSAGAPRTAEQQQQQQQQQRVLCAMLPVLLEGLRDTVLAQHRHRRQQEHGDMVPYSGPPTFQRCLAARQLAWLTQQLTPPLLTDPHSLSVLLPLLLAACDDPSPCVRQYGHSGLGWLGWSVVVGARGVLEWQVALLREEAVRLVVGCEEACWPTALPAATSLAMALEGKDQRSTTYHALMLELITGAERTAHKPEPRRVFISCVTRLVPQLGLYVVRHFAALMPLLLEWVHAFDEASSVSALLLLQQVVLHAWPRMVVHAGVVRQHVEEVLRQERVEQGARADGCQPPPRQQQHSSLLQQQQNVLGGRSSLAGLDVDLAGGSRRGQAAQQLLQLLASLATA